MAKDMSKVYGEMLTKELVQLRKRHQEKYDLFIGSKNRKTKAEALVLRELIAQINSELADRVSQFSLFV